ncbi:MAG TPA: ABC transporter substrate-binding protein [Acidimicrobiales bacterium]|jgi:putative spermidine/putrescine transport system substrate-binding protein
MRLTARALMAGAAAVTLSSALTTAALTTATAGSAGAAVNPATATSAAAFGGLSGLVTAAKKEGVLNVITLPADWANYGNIIKDFEKKYGIKINSENPDGTSQDEINAVTSEKGQSRAPDVLDMGTSFAITAAQDGLLAPYKVQTWSDIPNYAKASNGDWFDDYGGYVAIGYNSKTVKVPPTSFKSLLNQRYKNMVALNGNPTQAGAAFAAVYAAALANGGSLNNIEPGVQYFAKLHQVGNFVPVTGSQSTVESGQTPILIWWDYLQESEVAKEYPSWKVVIPSDGRYAAYYSQAISATAPDPAAARLWEEYLYSTTGQNLWLQGSARPIELTTLVKNGSVDKKAYNDLPATPAGTVTFPTTAQTTAAEAVVAQNWASAIGG